MKKVISLFLLVFLSFLLLTGCAAEKTLTDEEYNTLMQQLSTTASSGDRVVARNSSGSYIRKYIPEQLLANSPEEVGYILMLETDSNRASYTGGHVVFGEIIHAALVDSTTGHTIAEKTFDVVFPETVRSDVYTIPVSEEDVMTWLEHRHPGSDASLHTWAPADCTNAEFCNLCGLSRGDALGHAWIPGSCSTQRICSRCGAAHQEIPDHKVASWSFVNGNWYKMVGFCSACNKDIQTKTDWEMFHSALICDRWPLKYVASEDIKWRETTQEVYMDVLEDGTASILYQNQKLDFTWEYDPMETAASEYGWVYFTFTRTDTGESTAVKCLATELDIVIAGYDLDFARPSPQSY